MLESIGNLRNIAYGYAPNIRRQVNMACDEIEQEIAERYIELPVDADGVPIHVGDELYNGEVIAFGGLAEGGVVFVHRGFDDGNYILEAFASNITHHVKPRTIEEVLRDCCNEWNEHCGEDWESGVYAKYAEEIRGMMA